ncbi:Transposase [Oopsacas minuta]|uniref:Transposase n=1 Tax=Oopsacas minuta TaxID=111878 RepID=A0AAV7JLV4_9METZ|nr:Transposase [Oopsacas minuta]
MALDLKVSRCAMTKIVKRDLGMSSFKSKKVHSLFQLVKEKKGCKMQRCVGLVRCGNLERILFSDENIFNIQEATNVQNDRILASSPSKVVKKFRYVSRIQDPKSVMIWAGVSKMGRTPLVL